MTFCLFVRPFLLARAGSHTVLPQFFGVQAGFEWPTPMRRREYVRARIEEADGDYKARAVSKTGFGRAGLHGVGAGARGESPSTRP